MPPKSKIQAVNMLLHGWGYVEGKWVYVPLWDPAPAYKAFRYLIASAAVADAAKLVSGKTAVGKLHAISGSLLSKANAGFTRSWEDGDPICPPWPPWPIPHPQWPIPLPWPWPGPWPGPDPGPLDQFVRELSPIARNAVVGHLVGIIGESVGDRSVIEVGKVVMKAR